MPTSPQKKPTSRAANPGAPTLRAAVLDAPALLSALAAAAAHLERHVEAVNALNVFPVPDGDTGTNMSLTMRAALEEVAKQSPAPASGAPPTASGVPAHAGVLLEGLARGALMGARGNSGVILSQILRGFAKSAPDMATLNGDAIAAGLQAGYDQAYRMVPSPVEGTILTVARDAAAAARAAVLGTPAAVFDAAASAAITSVARTPDLLPILKENGVVDAGGQGFFLLLEGMAMHLAGRDPALAAVTPAVVARAYAASSDHDAPYGYCTEFLIERCTVPLDGVRVRMLALGQSVVVVGDDSLVKVHLHTPDPEVAFAYGRSVGVVARAKADNMDAQHRSAAAHHATLFAAGCAVVAVASGAGMTNLFRSLGAAAIVPGGQTMNPSTGDLLQAVLDVPAPAIFLLPNNGNIIPAARQVQALAPGKQVVVIPSRDLPQGVAALMAFNYEAPVEDNGRSMARALAQVKTGEVTRAVRPALLDGRRVAQGQAIALAGGALVAASARLGTAVLALLRHLGVDEGDAVTLYYGADVTAAAAHRIAGRAAKEFPHAQVHIVAGGQPHYHYLAAVE
ncbi:MAG: DAK2 domain-containing protein [Dehalococcoidia bacterium]|nr:DAK2 domain-containing protein [Dehalococcoidia bacterium]